MITPLPGVTTTKPGSACSTIPGVTAELVDDDGNTVTEGGGYLTIAKPWPSMLRGIWVWLLGRVDDVMNVSGHRISTAEIESGLVDHQAVAEAAVVGANDDTTGQAIVGYVILRGGNTASAELSEEIRQHVATKLGPIARPKAVFIVPDLPKIVPDLPKTRSGKIMRRLLRDVAEGRDLGDVDEIRTRAADSDED